jgi:hypothetical protein
LIIKAAGQKRMTAAVVTIVSFVAFWSCAPDATAARADTLAASSRSCAHE